MKTVTLPYDEHEEMVRNLKSYMNEIVYLKDQLLNLQARKHGEISMIYIKERVDESGEVIDVKTDIQHCSNSNANEKTDRFMDAKKLEAENDQLKSINKKLQIRLNFLESLNMQNKIGHNGKK